MAKNTAGDVKYSYFIQGKPISVKPIERVEETHDLVAALNASLQQKTKVKTKG
jgi:hypothetical protein